MTENMPDEATFKIPDSVPAGATPTDSTPTATMPSESAPADQDEPAGRPEALEHEALDHEALDHEALEQDEVNVPIWQVVERSAAISPAPPIEPDSPPDHDAAPIPPAPGSKLPLLIGIGAVVAALILVASVIGLAMWARDSAGSTPSVGAVGKIGQQLTDGAVTFEVTKVSCGLREVGTGTARRTPAGQFCAVEVAIANHGTETVQPQPAAYDKGGVRYVIDGPATAYLNDTVATQLRPGATVAGAWVFDVPAAATLARLEVHATEGSTGVTVKL